MSDDWIARPYQLKFRLGDLTLFSFQRPGLWRAAAFSPLGAAASLPEPPLDRLARGEAEVLVMRSVPVEATLPPLSAMPNALRYVPHQYLRYVADLRGPFDDYLKKFSSKSRSTLQRKVRKFAEACGGAIEWRTYRAPEDMAEFHRLARAVSAKTYQERLLDSGLPDGEEFLARLQSLAAKDAVRGYLLFLEQEPIAYLCCPIEDGVVEYQYVGFDAAQQKWSPGTVLQYLVFEQLFAEGKFRAFDFTEGEGAHKEFFATGQVMCADIFYFRRSLVNGVLVRLHLGVERFSAWLGKVLDRLGLKARVRRWLRGQ